MSQRLHFGLAASAIALFAVTGAALAQAPSKAEPAREHREHRVVIIDKGEMGAKHAEHLKAILQLRPNQEAALAAYLDATTPDHARMMRMHREERPKTTPERLAAEEKRLTERLAAGRARIAATQRFYDQLDPAQKRAFDALPAMHGPMMMGHGPMRIKHRRGHEGEHRIEMERHEQHRAPGT
jgi:periplasmic protein CpxP/Spy